MLLNHRQVLSTPGVNMSSNSGQAATGESSAPAQTSAANSQPSSAANTQQSSAAAQPTSGSSNNQSSAVASASATQASSSAQNTQPAQTSAAASSNNSNPTSSSNNNTQPTQAASSSAQAAPSTTAAASSSQNNNKSTTENSQPSTTQVTSEVERSTVITVTNSSGDAQTSIVVLTSTITNGAAGTDGSAQATSTSDSHPIGSSDNSSGGLSQKSKVAIGVVVPIAAIAILALVGLFLWKKRRSRKMAEEERRKEVEDYAYNPNADPTIPSVMGDGYEMREETSSGYRGWGSTTIGSTGRKASTTMSGGQTGQAYSDVTSPTTRGNMSDGRSNEPLMDGSYSPEGEILGAMGPNAANNRGADVHRGPSNASSSYSAARSDGSDPLGTSYPGGGGYYDQYAQNSPYDPYNGQPANAPVIRDNPARRNTRIENPSHYPQQSAGISQNF